VCLQLERKPELVRHVSVDGQEEGGGGGRESTEDRDLRRHIAVHRGGRQVPVVPLRHPAALHLRLRLSVLRPVLHHPHPRGVLVLGARVRRHQSHQLRKVSRSSSASFVSRPLSPSISSYLASLNGNGWPVMARFFQKRIQRKAALGHSVVSLKRETYFSLVQQTSHAR
jgi:hypothetical protein